MFGLSCRRDQSGSSPAIIQDVKNDEVQKNESIEEAKDKSYDDKQQEDQQSQISFNEPPQAIFWSHKEGVYFTYQKRYQA